MQDVRVRRGADVGSDHHLVPAMGKLKLQRSRNTKRHQSYFDVSKLKNDVTRDQSSVENKETDSRLLLKKASEKLMKARYN